MSYIGDSHIDERISLLGNQYIDDHDGVHHNNQLYFPHNIISYIFNLRFRPFFIIFIALTILSIISIAICFSSSSPTVHIVSEPAQSTSSPHSPPVGYEHCNLTDSDCTFNIPPKPTSTISPNDPFSLLDNEPQFQEMSVYFPKMLLLSNPYNTESTSIPTTLPFIHHSQTDDDDDDDSEDKHDGALRKILDDVPKKNYNKVKRQIEKEELARQNHDHHFPHVSMSETTTNSSSTSDALTSTRSITSFADDKNIDSNTTTVFKFYPGATEIDPNIHIGIGYSWFPTSISNHTQSSDRILQHSIIRSSNSNGVKTIHIQFDAPSIYIKLESQSDDDEKNTSKKGKKSKMNEQLHDEIDSSFRSFLYESHRDDITPIITLHYFQPHRDQYQWDWLDTKTIKLFVQYAKSIFPFFVEAGVDKIVTIHNWENYCTRTYSTNLFNAQLCQHNILKAHIETLTSLRQQCNNEQLIPILSNPNKLLHQHSQHRSKTKLSSSMQDKLNKFCSNIKFSIGLQSSYYISRIKNQIARIDYQLDYSTQSMTRLGSTLLTGHSGNKDYDFFESCPDINANMIQSDVVFSCDSNRLAQSHANLLSIGNTLNILFKGDNSRLYRKLITVALKSHQKITKKRTKSSHKNTQSTLNTTTGQKVNDHNDDELLNIFQFTKQERKMFKNNQPDFIYLEYSTTKYVFYDESCLDQVNTKFNQEQHRIQQSLQNPQAVHNFTFKARHPQYDLNCLRYTDFDITGLPIGPHPTPMVGNEHISITNSKHPNSITRLVPRGLTLLLQYVSDVTYLLQHPSKQRPPSLIPNVQLKKDNIPIIIAISVLMPHFDEMHQPKLDVLIKNSNYNPKAPNLRAQLYGASCLQDYYRTNALALYLTEVAMSTSQRNVNVVSVLYNNFIDPSHFDHTAKRNFTSGLVHVSDSNTLIDKLSMLWLQSETLFHSHINDSTNNK